MTSGFRKVIVNFSLAYQFLLRIAEVRHEKGEIFHFISWNWWLKNSESVATPLKWMALQHSPRSFVLLPADLNHQWRYKCHSDPTGIKPSVALQMSSLSFSFSHGSTALMCQGLLIVEVLRSHSDTPHSVGHLWTSDQPDAKTSIWQHLQETDIHAPGGIGTHNPSKWTAADPSLRPRGHWNRRHHYPKGIKHKWFSKCLREPKGMKYQWRSKHSHDLALFFCWV